MFEITQNTKKLLTSYDSANYMPVYLNGAWLNRYEFICYKLRDLRNISTWGNEYAEERVYIEPKVRTRNKRGRFVKDPLAGFKVTYGAF